MGRKPVVASVPKLASEWHPVKNGELTPFNVTTGSSRKVWWQCPTGHEWQAGVQDRVKGNGCPVHSGRVVDVGINDLATVDPKLASEWHPTKNCELTPSDVKLGSNLKVWWQCMDGHEWKAQVYSRAKGNGCPVHAGRVVVPGTNDLATVDPKTAAQWHPTKNEELTGSDVLTGSNRKIWWHCPAGHEWQAQVNERSRKGSGCPECLRRDRSDARARTSQVREASRSRQSPTPRPCPPHQSLGFVDPNTAAQWHPTKNGELTPSDIAAISNRKVWWQCVDGHEWQRSVGSMTRRSVAGCPADRGRVTVAGFNDLQTVNPLLAQQWHPTKNDSLKPTDVTAGTNKSVWWQCPDGHEWQAAVRNRNRFDSSCPAERGLMIVVGFNDLQAVNPSLAQQWHPTKNDSLKPTDVTAGANKSVWWICELGHEWKATVSIRNRTGSRCPFGARRGAKAAPGVTDLATMNASLASQWHPTDNGPLTPRDVLPQSARRVWWQCPKGHEWQAKVYNRTLGSGCPGCVERAGFRTTARSKVYLLEHMKLRLIKVGVCNATSTRIRRYSAMGWRLLDTVETDTGAEALVLEKQLLIFLRKQYPNIPEGLPVRIDSASRYLLGTSEMFDSTEIKEKSLMDILSVTNAAHPVLFHPASCGFVLTRVPRSAASTSSPPPSPTRRSADGAATGVGVGPGWGVR